MSNSLKRTGQFSIRFPEWFTYPLMIFLITRTVVILVGFIADVAIANDYIRVVPENLFIDNLIRFDSLYYLDIARTGYEFYPEEVAPLVFFNVGFFPGYPIAIKWINFLMGNLNISAIIVSHLSFLAALIGLYRLTFYEFDEAVAKRAVLYIAIFPTAFIFSTVYTESLFLALTIWAMVFARRKLWVWAVPFAMMATVTRITGILMFGVIGLEWLRHHGFTFTTIFVADAWRNLIVGIRTDWVNLLMLFMIPLGLLSHMRFLSIYFDDPTAYITAQAAWGRAVDNPLTTVFEELNWLFGRNFLGGEFSNFNNLFDFVAIIAVFSTIVFIWRRLESGYALYALLSMLIPVAGGTMTAAVRYAAIIFPFFMMLAVWGQRKWVDQLISIIFPVLMGLLFSLFANWIYTG